MEKDTKIIPMDVARKMFYDANHHLAEALEILCKLEDIMNEPTYGEYGEGNECDEIKGMPLCKCYEAINSAFVTLSSFPVVKLGGLDEIGYDSNMKLFYEIKKNKEN